jgi:predicted nucleic acid-binding protein
MTAYVVDASVAAKWFLSEEHSERCQKLLSANCQLLAPDLIWSEVGNVFWKRFRRGELVAEEAIDLIADFVRMPFEIVPSQNLLDLAARIALFMDITVYDALYVALALDRGCEMVTADEKLVKVLAGTSLELVVRHVSTLEVP